MRRPDVKTPGRGSGAGVGEAGEEGNLGKHSNKHGRSLCLCSANVICGLCFFRLRAEETFARARSLRLQAVGEPGLGGAWS